MASCKWHTWSNWLRRRRGGSQHCSAMARRTRTVAGSGGSRFHCPLVDDAACRSTRARCSIVVQPPSRHSYYYANTVPPFPNYRQTAIPNSASQINSNSNTIRHTIIIGERLDFDLSTPSLIRRSTFQNRVHSVVLKFQNRKWTVASQSSYLSKFRTAPAPLSQLC